MLPQNIVGVGRLKRTCCYYAKGAYLLELDHDDRLVANCIETVVLALENLPAQTFLYSDCLTLYPDNTSCRFHSEFGWRSYRAKIDENTFDINLSFPATARSLADMNFTPDHVRVWTRQAYEAAGGHDTNLAVCDDMDLIARTYITGAHFEHIQRPLYIRQFHAANTSHRFSKDIEKGSASVRDEYLHRLVLEWCRRSRLSVQQLSEVTVASLRAYPDDTVGAFILSDVLHKISKARIVSVMNQLYRALAPGGFVLTNTPSVCDAVGRVGRGAFESPEYASLWSENNFWYFTEREYAAKLQTRPQCRFQTVRSGYRYFSEADTAQGRPYVIWDAAALKNDDDADKYFPGARKI